MADIDESLNLNLVYQKFTSDIVEDLNDVLQDLHGRTFIDIPFTEEELTTRMLQRAIDYALRKITQWHPRIVRTKALVSDPKYTLLRAYTNSWDANSQEPYAQVYLDDLGTSFGDCYYYSVPWTLETITKNRLLDDYFRDFVTYRCGLALANIRRSANMNDIPFDLKGDAFYSEMTENLANLQQIIVNSAPNNI